MINKNVSTLLFCLSSVSLAIFVTSKSIQNIVTHDRLTLKDEYSFKGDSFKDSSFTDDKLSIIESSR